MALDFRERLAGTLRGLTAPPIARGKRQAQVLALASNKGGVGKTTTAVNVASALARRGLEVLLLDLDPQAHVAHALGLAHGVHHQPLGQVLLGPLREVVEVALPTPWARLSVAGSDKSLGETEIALAGKIGREMQLSRALSVTRSHYDVILIDCPPNLGTLTLNALCAADHLLIPTDMSALALEGVSDIIRCVGFLRGTLGRPVQVMGIVTTRFDRRLITANTALEESMNELWGDRLMRTKIPQSSSLNGAHMAGLPIFDHAPKSAGATGYWALADEVIALLRLPQSVLAGIQPEGRVQRDDGARA